MKKRIIYINVAVFVLAFLFKLISVLFQLDSFQQVMSYFEVPSSLPDLLTRPWTLITYMFVHYDILHILFNMLWLYWLADLFLNEYSTRNFVGLYILGGIGGGLFFICAYNIFPYFNSVVGSSYLLGASASVLSIMGALLYRIPDYELSLFMVGRVKFKYMALFIIGLDILLLLNSPGQHFAHLGGALSGYLFAYMYSKNVDLTSWINRILDYIVSLSGYFKDGFYFIRNIFNKSRKPKMKVHYGGSARERDYDYNFRKREKEEEINTILEKIKKNGYGALSKDEKRKLFDASRR